MLGALGVVRNMLQHGDPADPGQQQSYGIQNRFQPDFAAGAANVAAKPRFGPNSQPYAGMEKFNDTGGRFGATPTAGFDPMMRQRMLSQNLREPAPAQPAAPVGVV